MTKARDGRSRQVCLSQSVPLGFGNIYVGFADWAKHPKYIGAFLYVAPNANVKSVQIKYSMEVGEPHVSKKGIYLKSSFAW